MPRTGDFESQWRRDRLHKNRCNSLNIHSLEMYGTPISSWGFQQVDPTHNLNQTNHYLVNFLYEPVVYNIYPFSVYTSNKSIHTCIFKIININKPKRFTDLLFKIHIWQVPPGKWSSLTVLTSVVWWLT